MGLTITLIIIKNNILPLFQEKVNIVTGVTIIVNLFYIKYTYFG